MGIRESNNARVLLNGKSLNEIEKNNFVHNITTQFKSNLSYFEVYFNDSIDVTGVHITEESDTSKINGSKTLLMKPKEVIKKGDLIKWSDEYWLCISTELFNDIYYKGSISKTNNVIRFYDKTSISNAIITIPCIETPASKAGIDENKFMNLVKGILVITVPLNIQTRAIYKGQRFIFGRETYMVAGYDETNCDFVGNTGILVIYMESTETDVLNDDFVNGIAYNEGDVKNNYIINTLNGSSISFNVSQTVNINTQVINNGIVVTPTPELIHTSSDTLICTVDSSSGIITGISNGNCTIEIALKSEPTIKSTINVSVVSVVVDSYSIQYVNPVSQIKLGKLQSFNVKTLNNGIEVSKPVTFSIRNSDASTNVYAAIESTSGTNCVVKATTNTNYRNKYFYLKCSLVEDNSVFVETEMIKIASLI